MAFLDIMSKAYEKATAPKSLKEAQKVLAALGIKIKYDRDNDEYVVNYIKNPREATAYFTNDLQDAIGTGKQMAVKTKKEKASYDHVIKKILHS